MPLNKQSGNMFKFVTHTKSYVGGECEHKCVYCWVEDLKKNPMLKKRYSGEYRLIEKELTENLGEGKVIFVQSCGDLFANGVPSEFIRRTLEHCNKYPDNHYFFQTKNPWGFWEFEGEFPKNTTLSTTIETNRDTSPYSRATQPRYRANELAIAGLSGKFKISVTVEPVMDFDLKELVDIIGSCDPDWVSVGADSKNHDLPEPSPEKVGKLISELKNFVEVRLKDNLKRIKPGCN